MSRAPHEPTAESRQKVRSLAAVGLPHEDIAIIADCSEKTLRKHYREELDEGASDANAAVVGFLMAAIGRKNIAAMIFFEKARGGKRETVREEISEVDGGPLRMPCNGIGPCPRHVLDYKPGDEDLPPRGTTEAETAEEFERIMAMAKKP